METILMMLTPLYLIGSGILAILFGYLYNKDARVYLLMWTLFWAHLALGYLFQSFALLFEYDIFGLLSAVTLIIGPFWFAKGTFRYAGYSPNRAFRGLIALSLVLFALVLLLSDGVFIPVLAMFSLSSLGFFMSGGVLIKTSISKLFKGFGVWYALYGLSLIGFPLSFLAESDTLQWMALFLTLMFGGGIFLIMLILHLHAAREQARRHTNKLYRLSYRDMLTNLHNRNYFDEQLTRMDTPEHWPLSLITCDIDNLKTINDALGHEKGDDALKRIAITFAAVLPENAVMSRYGGDEFLIALPDTDEAGAHAVKESLREATRQRYVKGHEITVSIGFATKSKASMALKTLKRLSDTAMYEDKRHRKAMIL